MSDAASWHEDKFVEIYDSQEWDHSKKESTEIDAFFSKLSLKSQFMWDNRAVLGACKVPSNLYYEPHQIPTLKCFLSHFAVVSAQSN